MFSMGILWVSSIILTMNAWWCSSLIIMLIRTFWDASKVEITERGLRTQNSGTRNAASRRYLSYISQSAPSLDAEFTDREVGEETHKRQKVILLMRQWRFTFLSIWSGCQTHNVSTAEKTKQVWNGSGRGETSIRLFSKKIDAKNKFEFIGLMFLFVLSRLGT